MIRIFIDGLCHSHIFCSQRLLRFYLNSIESLPLLLIKARIAANLTQKDLAKQLGLKEQQIQRYEATDYASASLSRIIQVSQKLNIKLIPHKTRKRLRSLTGSPSFIKLYVPHEQKDSSKEPKLPKGQLAANVAVPYVMNGKIHQAT